MAFFLSMVSLGAVVIAYVVIEKRINQRACPRCGFTVSIDALDEQCPRCDAIIEREIEY